MIYVNLGLIRKKRKYKLVKFVLSVILRVYIAVLVCIGIATKLPLLYHNGFSFSKVDFFTYLLFFFYIYMGNKYPYIHEHSHLIIADRLGYTSEVRVSKQKAYTKIYGKIISFKFLLIAIFPFVVEIMIICIFYFLFKIHVSFIIMHAIYAIIWSLSDFNLICQSIKYKKDKYVLQYIKDCPGEYNVYRVLKVKLKSIKILMEPKTEKNRIKPKKIKGKWRKLD